MPDRLAFVTSWDTHIRQAAPTGTWYAIVSPVTREIVPGDPGAWALVYRQVCHESAPADRSTADLVAGLAAHWLRAGLDINTRDRNEPNVVREEITRTLMRHSIPPPWITTSEERAFALTEQSS